MNESQQITVLVALTLVIGVIGVIVVPFIQGGGGPSDVSIDNYNAIIYANGTLREDFTYTFTNYNYQMMYRDWNAAISTTPTSSAHIQPLSISAPPGTTTYIKDDSGAVTIVGGTNTPDIRGTIGRLAYDDEVGCYNPGHFGPGTQSISYLYQIYPPLETDGTVTHLNLMLASIHIPYRSVKITLMDSSYIEAVYVHPLDLTVTSSSGSTVITGTSGNDELLEVEILMNPSQSKWMSGSWRPPIETWRRESSRASFVMTYCTA